jgi:hypothetical protein
MSDPIKQARSAETLPKEKLHKKGAKEGGASHTDHIRPELNIEKWPGMWRPSRSKRPPIVRVLEREHSAPGGSRVQARVEVGFTHLGELTTEDQKTYYALVKQWEASGEGAQQTFFSVRGLARFLHKQWGTNVITAITESLRRLRATPLTWENAYFDTGSREVLEEINTFNVLSELKIIRRKVDGAVTKEAGYFRFNDFTLKNLLNHHTKPVLFETILRFRSDLAQLLYSHLDLIMADKRSYARRTRELFTDLGLCGSDYARSYERKRALSGAIAELRGVSLTTGVITAIGIEKTQDEKDYKLTVSKGSSHIRQAEIREPSLKRGVTSQEFPAASSPAATEAEELVRYFHRLFHNLTKIYPQSKEITHATTLIAQHGVERAKYIIDYAHRAAAETHYTPQTFGGIMQYASKAMPAYEEFIRKSKAVATAREETVTRRAFETLQSEVDEKRRKNAEARLASLPPNEYQALFAKAKADLLVRSHWVPQDENSMFFKRFIHGAMIGELMRQAGDSEPTQLD